MILGFMLATLLYTGSALAETGTVKVNDLMLRKAASTRSDVLQTLDQGDKVEIIGKDGSWYKVRYGRYTGFVYASYVNVSAAAADAAPLKFGDYSADVKKMQERLKELGYFEGYCMNNFGEKTLAAVKAFQGRNGLTQDGIAGKATLDKLYSSSAKKAGDGTLRYGDYSAEVQAMQERLKELGYFEGTCMYNFGEKTLAAVKAFQGRNGLTQDGVAGKATLDKLYSSSAREAGDGTLRYGDYCAEVKEMQERLKELGYFEGTCMNNFGEKTQAAVKAFQKANGLTASGVADPATQKKLNSSSAITKAEADAKERIETERLDWFKKGKWVFPKRAILSIKDCKTGLIFDARVLYGTNHLDAEPLTKADTQTLLAINGGVDFSYHRRPVLVQYNGHVYAASIYCEPHGDQTILDNDFDGQFCLHFYGSRTHGTDRVDEDHKACEEQALKATW